MFVVTIRRELIKTRSGHMLGQVEKVSPCLVNLRSIRLRISYTCSPSTSLVVT